MAISNTLTELIPKILARTLLTLRNQAVMPNLVLRGMEQQAAAQYQTITIPLSSAQSVGNVTPATSGPTSGNTTISSVSVTLNNWRNTYFGLNDQELTQIDAEKNFIPGQMRESAAVLADDVNAYIFGLYLGVYGYSGTAGTTPFQTNARAITTAKKLLNQQKCPTSERFAVLGNDAAEEVLNLSSFADASQTGENRVKIEGEMGRKYGFDFYEDNAVVTHTAGTDAGAATINSETVEPIGETTIKLKAVGGNLALLEGDIITIAGDTQTYVVDADVSITSGSTDDCDIVPGLKVATAGDEAITIKATHIVNLAFNRNAFAFVSMPTNTKIARQAGAIISSMQDPVTGIVLEAEIIRQYKQVVFDVSILYGASLIEPARACRIAG